jgi:hypothetical protein
MASLLPVTLTVGGERVEARYVYAVATLPAYRGQGLSTQILSYAKERFGLPLLLQVENGSCKLEEFYEKQGFFQAFQKQERQELPVVPSDERDAKDVDEPELVEIAPAAYRKLRDAHFAGEGYVAWSEDAIAYALNENRFCRGSAYLVRSGEQQDILLVRAEEDKLRIIETTLSDDDLLHILPALCEEMQATQCFRENGGGMLWMPEGLSGEVRSGYLNLTLG